MPVKTYFMQTQTSEFSLICIVSSLDKYYTFTVSARRKDETNWYVSDISKEIKKYNSLDELEKEWLDMEKVIPYFLEKEVSDEEIAHRMQTDTYSYNSSPSLPELKHPEILSPEPVIKDLTESLTTGNITGFYSDPIKNEWLEIINFFKEKSINSIESIPFITNIPLNNCTSYHTRINYLITCEDETDVYEFYCDVSLENGKWKIIEISPVETIGTRLQLFSF